MYVFPFPAFLLFAAQQLDVLHTVDELHQIILIDGHLFKVLPVQVGPLAHEQLYPTHIGCAEQNENEEYFPAVYGQHDTEDDYREGREQNIEHGLGEETLDAVVVFDAAYQVACQFAVKEPHGQPHQLGEEIRDERHVDARTDVEQYTAPDHLNKCAAEYQHELCDQNELYKIQIPVPYALVYNGLGEKREDQLQQTAGQQADDELYHRLFVGTYIVKQIP